MKLRVYSDIHLEFAPFSPPSLEADAIELAGDIGKGLSGLEWAQKQFPSSEIVHVAGNHEFYRARLPDAIWRRKPRLPPHDNSAFELDLVWRFEE